MPKGNTATISVESFRVDWESGLPIAVICANYTITRDQVVRLRDLWGLQLRHDRKARHVARTPDPTPAEIAERCLEIQARWSDKVRQDRHWRKPVPWSVVEVELPENLDDADLQGWHG